MTALTQDRDTRRREKVKTSDPVAAATKVFGGSIVALNATGFAEPGSTATTLVARGIAAEQVDNSGGADGDLNIEVEQGVHRVVNDGSIARADIGGLAYIVDDQTVADTDGGSTRSVAGTIYDVDSVGVWVDFG